MNLGLLRNSSERLPQGNVVSVQGNSRLFFRAQYKIANKSAEAYAEAYGDDPSDTMK